MSAPTILIDGRKVQIEPGQTVLEAARSIGIDIPTLCFLEKCGPLNSCQVCLVKTGGKLVPSCGTKVHPGMVVESETEEVHEARRTALELLFSDHVGDCLAPCQRLCPLGLNIPTLLRQVRDKDTSGAAQTVRSTLPLAGVLGRLCHHPCEQGCRRGHWDSPAAIREIERHIAELDLCNGRGEGMLPKAKNQDSGTPLAIIGAGPSGLAAAFYLVRQGCKVTVFDRHTSAGGQLRNLPEQELPQELLASEIALLQRSGVRFEFGRELGRNLAFSEVTADFRAVLIAIGEPDAESTASLGLPVSGKYVVSDPNNCKTPVPHAFATGAAVRPTRQLVRVMAEAKTAAECMLSELAGKPPTPAGRPFSSVMGKLDPGELKQFLASSSPVGSVTPCDRCAGLNRVEAVSESSRCLSCDCNSSGNCVLQHYAQIYNTDANRFRSGRKPFERFEQPGGVIFEPGKCILCGICVKLTELAAEPIGLAFVGRGFNVRVSAPLNHTIEEGLGKVAAECVKHCPTGALSFGARR